MCCIYRNLARRTTDIGFIYGVSDVASLPARRCQLYKLLRALIGITMFQSAYMAEVIRGGLQAIPKGQYEAASALGLGYWRSMGLVILPQALKLVIPGIVNTFIAFLKTPL